MRKGILFDLDGTLWDSSHEVVEAWNAAIRAEGRPEQITLDDMHSYMGRTMEAIAAMMFPNDPTAEQIRLLQVCTAAEHGYLMHHAPALYSGEREIIAELAREYTLGIVSNCQDGYIQIYLHHCGFAELFTDIECAGRTGKSKGENIRLVMERQGLDSCIYVGDTQGDADAARLAGIPFFHAAYGFGTVDRADAVLNDLRELPEKLST